jgi:hypothetical protein
VTEWNRRSAGSAVFNMPPGWCHTVSHYLSHSASSTYAPRSPRFCRSFSYSGDGQHQWRSQNKLSSPLPTSRRSREIGFPLTSYRRFVENIGQIGFAPPK